MNLQLLKMAPMDFDETFRDWRSHCPVHSGIGHKIWEFLSQDYTSGGGCIWLPTGNSGPTVVTHCFAEITCIHMNGNFEQFDPQWTKLRPSWCIFWIFLMLNVCSVTVWYGEMLPGRTGRRRHGYRLSPTPSPTVTDTLLNSAPALAKH